MLCSVGATTKAAPAAAIAIPVAATGVLRSGSTIRTGTTVYPVTVVSVAGQPGYVWTPTTAGQGSATTSTTTGYDAANHVLATFSRP